MFSVVPFLLCLVSYLFWFTYYKIKKLNQDYNGKSISTLVILLFLIHPNLVQIMFSDFQCTPIDDKTRVWLDLEIICWSGVHKFVSYFIALPSIIAWGIGIPFFAFILLMRVRNKLDLIETKEKYGFLYRGYRKELYYWEIIIMYRKIVMIFISVFISMYGVISQALIVFILLIAFLILNTKKKPFSTVALNDLETISLLASMITVYCGIFFISDAPSDWLKAVPEMAGRTVSLGETTKFIFFLLIVISNTIFLAYWTYKMYQEIKLKLMMNFKKLYICLFECGNEQRFEREFAKVKVAEDNTFLRDELTRCKIYPFLFNNLALRKIKEMHSKGDLVLNDINVEKLKVYLQPEKILKIAGVLDKKNYELSKRM